MPDHGRKSEPESQTPGRGDSLLEYQAPRVELLGNLAELTQGIPGGGGDAGFPGHAGS